MKKFRYILILLTLLLSGNISASSLSQNSFGSIGMNFTPTARFLDDGSISVSYGYSESFRRLNLLAQPYDWLEVSIFYADIPEREYPAAIDQSLKDKGFNAKFKISDETNKLPAIALGLTDFAGSGVFSGEYIVASKSIKNFDLTLGLGWGLYDAGIVIDNPFELFSSRFQSRNYDYDSIGEFDSDDYFSGNDSSIFGSAQYVYKDHKFIFEINPVDSFYERFGTLNIDSKLYLGYEYNNDLISSKFFYGDKGDINFQIGASYDYKKVGNKKFNKPKIKDKTKFVNLLKALQANDIGLREAYINEQNELVLEVRHNSYPTISSAKENISKSLNYADVSNGQEVLIKHFSFGKEIVSEKINSEKISESQKSKKILNIFSEEKSFPFVSTKIAPSIRTLLAARENFLLHGLFLDFNADIFLSENKFFESKMIYSVADNFDDLFLEPITTYPNQVRSDIKDYLKNSGDKPGMERLTYTQFEKNKDNYFMIHLGLLEQMYGGYGFEYLKMNRFRNLGYGFELYDVKKRNYDLTGFQDYGTITGHVNFYHHFNPLKLTSHISIGKYLAGDVGATFNFSRRFNNGLKFGFYFTKTDVTSEQFGEGSFDKGIYFSIPLPGFNSSKTNFHWRPLTKDPGQKLNLNRRIFDVVENYMY